MLYFFNILDQIESMTNQESTMEMDLYDYFEKEFETNVPIENIMSEILGSENIIAYVATILSKRKYNPDCNLNLISKYKVPCNTLPLIYGENPPAPEGMVQKDFNYYINDEIVTDNTISNGKVIANGKSFAIPSEIIEFIEKYKPVIKRDISHAHDRLLKAFGELA